MHRSSALQENLIGLRDPNALDKLPPAERQECRTLWRDLDVRLIRTSRRQPTRILRAEVRHPAPAVVRVQTARRVTCATGGVVACGRGTPQATSTVGYPTTRQTAPAERKPLEIKAFEQRNPVG